MLDHEKLEVDQLGIEFVAEANDFIERLPRGRGYLSDQLQRAALSIVLNTADACYRLTLTGEAEWSANKIIIKRIVEMLTKLIKTHQRNANEPR
jgi:hypothetical protein